MFQMKSTVVIWLLVHSRGLDYDFEFMKKRNNFLRNLSKQKQLNIEKSFYLDIL